MAEFSGKEPSKEVPYNMTPVESFEFMENDEGYAVRYAGDKSIEARWFGISHVRK